MTTFFGYPKATLILLGLALTTFLAEFWWIEIVYNRFPILRDNRSRGPASTLENGGRDSRVWSGESIKGWLKREKADWAEFAGLPIFASKSVLPIITNRLR
jgi:iron-regulated transporter 1